VTGGQQDKLFDEVMQLHDEIMPGTTNLGKLQGPLKSLLATPDSIPKGFTKDDVIETSMHVEKAYNDMMDWMRDFKLPENMNPSDKISYLQAEKSKLLKMKDETNSAYNEASAIIKGSK
jgi:hypothetical protein